MGVGRASADLETLLRRTDALQTGHFSLSSGMHSSQYIQCALLLQHPDLAAGVCGALAERFRGDRPQVVIAPAMGGIFVAYEVARALGVRALLAERVNGTFTLRRSQQIQPGERTVVVEDVVTTGGSVHEVLRLVDQCGGVFDLGQRRTWNEGVITLRRTEDPSRGRCGEIIRIQCIRL